MMPVTVALLRILISCVALWLAFSLLPEGAFDTLRGSSVATLALLSMINVCGLFLMSIRLLVLSSPFPLTWRASLGVTWIGQFGACLGLGIVSSDGARIARLVQLGQKPLMMARLIFLDRVFGLNGLIIIATASWVAFATNVAFGVMSLVGLSIVVIIITSQASRLPFLSRRLMIPDVTAAKAILALVLSISIHCLIILIFLLAAWWIDFHPSVFPTVLAVSLGLVFAILPISLGGWGVRELAILKGYALIGIDAPQAIEASLLLGAVTTVVALPGVFSFLMPTNTLYQERTASEAPPASSRPGNSYTGSASSSSRGGGR